MTFTIGQPVQLFNGLDGLPLPNGKVYIGEVNKNPEQYPIQVYWDLGLTVVAPQPIILQDGFPYRSGSPAKIYISSDYSISVKSKTGSLLFNSPSGNAIEQSITSVLAKDTLVSRGVDIRFGEIVNLKDFGAMGDGVTDDTNAINLAIEAVKAGGVKQGYSIFAPSGVYRINGSIRLRPNTKIFGEGAPSNPPGTTSGGYGTEFVGYGSGNALFYTEANPGGGTNPTDYIHNNNIMLRDIGVTADASSNYTWAIFTSGMRSSKIENCTFGQGRVNTANGCAWFNNPDPGGWGAGGPPVWINDIINNTFGCATGAGYVMYSVLTDSRFIGNYFSGGLGSKERGRNNIWSSNMFDLASADGLSIAPQWLNAGSYTLLANCNFQLCNSSCVAFSDSGAAFATDYRSLIVGCTFNQTVAGSTDLYIGNCKNLVVSGNSFASSSASNVVLAGYTQDISFSGNWAPLGIQKGTGCVYSGNLPSTVNTQMAPVAPTMLNSWISGDVGVAGTKYFKDADGIVHITGHARGGTNGTVIFNLPSGYRPSSIIKLLVLSNSAIGWLSIGTSGDVLLEGGTTTVYFGDVTFNPV